MKLGLTKRQTECLAFIKKFILEEGWPPTNDEIIAGLGLKARSAAVRLLRMLEGRGHIVREKHKARSIALVPDVDEELVHLREIRLAAAEFLTQQKRWREMEATLGEDANAEQATQVSESFKRLGDLVAA